MDARTSRSGSAGGDIAACPSRVSPRRVRASATGGASRIARAAAPATPNDATPITTDASLQVIAASRAATRNGMTSPPTLLPVAATPVIRPRMWGYQAATSRPVGSTVIPNVGANCRKLTTYQCQSSVISGRRQKLSPNTASETTRNRPNPVPVHRATKEGGSERADGGEGQGRADLGARPAVGLLDRHDEQAERVLRDADRNGGGREDDRDDEGLAQGLRSIDVIREGKRDAAARFAQAICRWGHGAGAGRRCRQVPRTAIHGPRLRPAAGRLD